MKTKILTERQCYHCQSPKRLLFFRFVEHDNVYFFAKCCNCKHSYRGHMPLKEWKHAHDNEDSLNRLTKHHRLPRSHNGGDEPENISMVTEKKHQAWHCIFSSKTPEEIVADLNNIWLPPNVKIFITTLSKNKHHDNSLTMGNGRSNLCPKS